MGDGVGFLFLSSILLTLLLAHLALAYLVGQAVAPWVQVLAIGVQAVVVTAILLRRRRSPGAPRQLWLMLALAVLAQMLWGGWNLLAGLLGPGGEFLTSLAVMFSGLYMIPCMLLIARSFDRKEPRAVLLLDLILSVVVAMLMYELVMHALPGSPHSVPGGIYVIIYHADAIDFTLAVMASLRLLGADSARRRYVYFAAAGFLWINAIAAAAYNRMELHGLPWWAGSMLDVAFAALAWIAIRPAPRWVLRYRPPQQLARVLAGFAPIILSLGVLWLGISVSRLHLLPGVVAAVVSVIFYGLRVAFIQSRDRDIQRLTTLSNERLQRQLGKDPLTGIANRASLDARLHEVVEDSQRHRTPCALLMIDIDYFKQFNDTQGHIVGDACLVKVAGAFSACLMRSGDLVARYGGEEFAVVLPDTSAAQAEVVARRLLDVINSIRIPHPGSPVGHVTVSIGVAARQGGAPCVARELLEQADRAMYRAKHQGKNRFEMSLVTPVGAQSVA